MNWAATSFLLIVIICNLIGGCGQVNEQTGNSNDFDPEGNSILTKKELADLANSKGQEQFYSKQENLKTQADTLGFPIDDFILFRNTDIIEHTNQFFKNKSIKSGFHYPTARELMRFYDTVTIENRNYFIVEGDILLNQMEIFLYHFGRGLYLTDTSKFQGNKLVGEIRGGHYVKQNNPRDIKYSIIRKTFTRDEYEIVSNAMLEAANDWQNMCNVRLEHVKSLDEILSSNSNPEELTFVVKKVNVLGHFIANSFFPYSPKHERKLFIDESFFQTDFSKTGVLRHEIGHILGFLHEQVHSGAPPVCPWEPRGSAIDLSRYDPKSVMHYFCDKVGTKSLLLTKQDSLGAIFYYPF